MKIKGFKMLLIAVFTFCVALTSCSPKDDYYSIGDFIIAFGIVDKPGAAGDNYYTIKLDNGSILKTVNDPKPGFAITHNQRVLVNFNPLDDEINPDKTKTYIGKINDIKNILYKSIILKSAMPVDTLGNDPINVPDAWVSGDSILTVEFNYYTAGLVHHINMMNTEEGNGMGKPHVFELRHNAKGDQNTYKISGYMSFKLKPYRITGADRTYFNVRYTDYSGKKIEIPLSFRN